MKRRIHLHHIIIFFLIGLFILASVLILANIQTENFYQNSNVTFGVSYSPDYAKSLGLDPKKTFISALEDLKVRNFRLNVNWDEIEPEKDQYDFKNLDWYLNEAQLHQAKVVLGVGYKLPRWPECRAPSWASQADVPALRTEQLAMVRYVINHYNQNPTISAFQIENEPMFPFGECPTPDPKFLETEISMVRSITNKQIILTDAGELSSWVKPMQLSDVFGTTLYRVVETPWIGIFQYPLRPWFYSVKSDLIRKFFAPQNKKTIIAELQAEPWADKPIYQVPINTQVSGFSVTQLQNSIIFAKKTGFDEVYLWGIEWWYYMSSHNHPEYLNYIKNLF